MKEHHVGWPTYLALTIGVVVLCDYLFDLVGLHDFTWGGALVLAIGLILGDFLFGDTPTQRQRKGEDNG